MTKHCVPNCREANIGYKLYGDGVYSGDSQVCMAAIHAGVIEDGFGGDVAIVKQGLGRSVLQKNAVKKLAKIQVWPKCEILPKSRNRE